MKEKKMNINVNKEKKESKQKNNKRVKTTVKSRKILKNVLFISTIVLISLVSFGGIYIKDKNKMVNVLPHYKLGTDIYGSRNVVMKVNASTETKNYDAEGNLIEDTDETTEVATTEEIPVNDTSLLTTDNYKKVKEIIISRLKYVGADYYEIKLNEEDGTVYLEVPENSNTDYIAQYCVTKGDFKVQDEETDEVLLANQDLKEANVKYSTSTTGTTVYLEIVFNKEGKEKLEDISNTYVKTTDAEGNETTKNIKMTLDDETIISTYFDEEITDGILALSLGTSSDTSEIQDYVQQASNIAIFLNTETLPIEYEMEINRFIYSDITNETLYILIGILVAIMIAIMVIMIVKYKFNGLLGAVTNIGFIAILLLVLRYTNVNITLAGIITIAVAAIIQYIILMDILKVYKKELNKEDRKKEIKNAIRNIMEKIIPLAILAVVFALMSWEPIYSVGMILFWTIITLIIYDTIVLKIMFKNK